MVAKKRNVILINIVIVVASIMASLYYYYCLSNISIPFHSDDAGSTDIGTYKRICEKG